MANRILYNIAFAPPEDRVQEYQEFLENVKRADTEVKVVALERTSLGLNFRYYLALVLPDILHIIKNAEQEGYDAAIIGCFNDPGLQVAKEMANIVVTAPAEASLHIAATLGQKFSIIVGEADSIPPVMENIMSYGLKDKLASFRSIGLRASELRKNEEETAHRIRQAAREALEQDLAEVIILGCTVLYGFSREIQKNLGVPVIDPVVAAFKYAELLIELKKRFHWWHSERVGFEHPPKDRILT